MPLVTKTQQAVDLWNCGEVTKALRMFKGFRLGVTKTEKDSITVYYEMLTGKRTFYESLGKSFDEVKQEAEQVLTEKFISR